MRVDGLGTSANHWNFQAWSIAGGGAVARCDRPSDDGRRPLTRLSWHAVLHIGSQDEPVGVPVARRHGRFRSGSMISYEGERAATAARLDVCCKNIGETRMKILVKSAWGSDDPTKAAFAFLHANAFAEAGHEVQIFLLGEAVSLMKDAVMNSVVPVGWSPLSETIPKTIQHKIPLHI